jgi:Winged helix DNA-binding domain
MTDDRALNRALLARQGLLERTDGPALAMIERLVGMQAQEPPDPYVGLWTRLEGFAPPQLSVLIEGRQAVRAGLMRGTIHLVSAPDLLAIQPLTLPILAGQFRSIFAKHLGAGAALEDVVRAGRELLLEAPRTRAELGRLLAPLFPDTDASILGHAVVHHVPLVQVPPRGLWGRSGQATWALTPEWVGDERGEADIDRLVLRYLAAFGPATAADVRTWSRITGLRAVIDRLRPGLRTFRDERGRELLDVPDGPLPDPETPAPPRFLPAYDNVLLSHDDRSRVTSRNLSYAPIPTGRFVGSLLVDGFLRAMWKFEDSVLSVDGFALAPGEGGAVADAVVAEGEALLEMLAPEDPKRRVELTR